MRIANKIIKMTVAVLLSLALITSCIASGVFAKYTTAKDALATVGMKAFGVTVTAIVDPDLKAAVSNKSVDDTAVIVDLGELQIAPGEDFRDAVYFKIEGVAEVPVRVKIDVDLSFNVKEGQANTFFIPGGIGGVPEGGEYRFPIGFRFLPVDSSELSHDINANTPWREVGPNSSANTIHNVLKQNMDVENDGTSSAATFAYKDFAAGEEIVFYRREKVTSNGKTTYPIVEPKVALNEFYLGFHWPMDASNSDYTSDQLDEITMYYNSLPDNETPKFTVKFIVTVEQI